VKHEIVTITSKIKISTLHQIIVQMSIAIYDTIPSAFIAEREEGKDSQYLSDHRLDR